MARIAAEMVGPKGSGRNTPGKYRRSAASASTIRRQEIWAMAVTSENTSRFAQANGARIHYHEAGSGPVLIAIHGGAPGAFGRGKFGRNMEALSRHFRTIIVDLPGYGKSDKPLIEGGQYGFYSKIFVAMMDVLGIDKAHLVGLATGGGAAIEMALDWRIVLTVWRS
jgi:2-hydroxy-6-oxonona-2,4-dienedioate hydrolase/4,5:9,10-diseco-3-hydroxy-5,9,17-trioxoandrosta-1(10),2-diene-4-oate hydrolase